MAGKDRLWQWYRRVVLDHPVWMLCAIGAVFVAAAVCAPQFRLDASADSLVLEGDRDVAYYRLIRARYGSDDFLVVTYTPQGELFSPAGLAGLKVLRDSLRDHAQVESVLSLLDVPLIDLSDVSLQDFRTEILTLQNSEVEPDRARQTLLENPLYRNRLLSADGRTTALQVDLKQDPDLQSLLSRRRELRQQKLAGKLDASQQRELGQLEREIQPKQKQQLARERRAIGEIRTILDQRRQQADIHLGGVPMIVADMISFIRHDLLWFGLGVFGFIVVLLVGIFRKLRWVLLPLACCSGTVLCMFGFLGLFGWPVTVVSSNFPAILLILTMSLTVHLAVRYNEILSHDQNLDAPDLTLGMVRSKATPCINTALTTMVAFCSLIVSDIRPVIDFGWMMAVGIVVSLVLSFTLLPAVLTLLPPKRFPVREDLTGRLIRAANRSVERHPRLIMVSFLVGGAALSLGMLRLETENRFIDHFRESTEIHQGMTLIDRKLGGTIPLDVIVDAPEGEDNKAQPDPNGWFADPFAEPDGKSDFTSESYWYGGYGLDRVGTLHDLVEQSPQTGSVLSLATTREVLREVNDGRPLENWLLAVIYEKMPGPLKKRLIDPYLAPDGNQIRLAARIRETAAEPEHAAFLQQLRQRLIEEGGLQPEQLRLTGLYVLYNNMLQSLYSSQVKTLGLVFLVILVMFMGLFRSVRLALIAIVPNLVAAGTVLGLLGWLGIPLDIMTITIAAITIGIAVDDTIHYVHRFRVESAGEADLEAVIRRCHDSVGRAMFYTSVIIIFGFSILTLSNFMPSIYFGVFTGVAMAVAVLADLTLLPVLLIRFAPRQAGGDSGAGD